MQFTLMVTSWTNFVYGHGQVTLRCLRLSYEYRRFSIIPVRDKHLWLDKIPYHLQNTLKIPKIH